MAASSNTLHESGLSPETVDRHRAIVSLMEELEAVDWYDQRVEAASDAELRDVLRHNRDEEKEHAAMMLEWLRRNDAGFHKYLKTYLFTKGPIRGIEARAEAGGEAGAKDAPSGANGDGSLGIGSLKSVNHE
jgi:ferritin-like protein